ncbi:hypothetical protein [Paracoccus aminophilus]|uniref:Uncharacterized protein n=1 Tax=Paracoccus aminophilus JCM 7686 TaxID=1367847 RepID=S5XPA6_PARAH|nr:hypothetical protein [Paracoccus aminophilus]AGT09159.1 hypothetical protein JCM7686_2078 [Paracoccus aminophilus JCM 7686]
MRRIGWLVVALICAALTVVVIAWPALTELRQSKNWQITRVEGDSGTLGGVTVRVEAARGMIMPARPDRALLFLRLSLQGNPDELASWLGCDLALSDPKGRSWFPVSGALADQILDRLSDVGTSAPRCSQSLFRAPKGGATLSEQVFVVPVDTLTTLRVELSSTTTRPKALSLPFTPRLRPPV